MLFKKKIIKPGTLFKVKDQNFFNEETTFFSYDFHKKETRWDVEHKVKIFKTDIFVFTGETEEASFEKIVMFNVMQNYYVSFLKSWIERILEEIK